MSYGSLKSVVGYTQKNASTGLCFNNIETLLICQLDPACVRQKFNLPVKT